MPIKPPHKLDLHPTADHWDGPYFRPFILGEETEREVLPAHRLWLDAVDPEGSWLFTLRGHGYYRDGTGELHLLEAGVVLAVHKPCQGELVRKANGLPWNYLWISVTGALALQFFDLIVGRFGPLHRLPLRGDTQQAVRAMVRFARKQLKRPPHEWSAHTFAFLNAWWREAEDQQCRAYEALHSAVEHHATLAPPTAKSPVSSSKLLSFEPRTVQNFAKILGYSRSHLERRLGEVWQRPPGKVLREARLQEAARLLRMTRLNVNDVARKVGYRAPTAFIRAFRRAYGMPPTHYRHKLQHPAFHGQNSV